MSSGLIVLVDDSPAIRRLYHALLTDAGFLVVTSGDGVEAVRMLRSVVPKVLITDVLMPQLNGIEFCRRVRPIIGYDVPLVVLTALDDLETLKACLSAGADDFILKSGGRAQAVKRIVGWATLGRKRLSETNRRRALQRLEEDAAAAPPVGADAGPLFDEVARRVQQHLKQAPSPAAQDSRTYPLGYAAGLLLQLRPPGTDVRRNLPEFVRLVGERLPFFAPGELADVMGRWSDLPRDVGFTLGFEQAQPEEPVD